VKILCIGVFFFSSVPLPETIRPSDHMMTDQDEEGSLEQFGPGCMCENEECQSMYARYKAIYEQHVGHLEQIHKLTQDNQLLSSEIKHRVAFLELNKQQLGQMLEHEKMICDILQHKTNVSTKNTSGGLHPVCEGCMYHRSALVLQRSLNSNNYPNVRAVQEEGLRVLKSAQDELMAEKLINGKLRVKIQMRNDPFWKDREVTQLGEEVSRYKSMYEESSKHADALKGELDKCKQQLLISNEKIDMLETELIKAKTDLEELATANQSKQKSSNGMKRKHEDSDDRSASNKEDGKAKKALTATMDAVLRYRLGLVFSVVSEGACEYEENFLYDTFRQSIDQEDLVECFESMYKACHPGESLSLRDKKLLKEGVVRVCKGPFSACLNALGGESRKRCTQTIWTNLAIKKRNPVRA